MGTEGEVRRVRMRRAMLMMAKLRRRMT